MKQLLWKCIVALVAIVGLAAMALAPDVSAGKKRAPRRIPFSIEKTDIDAVTLAEAPGNISLTITEMSASAQASVTQNHTIRFLVWTINGSSCPSDWNGVSILGEETLRTFTYRTYTTNQLTFLNPPISVAAPGAGKAACLVATLGGDANTFPSAGASGFRIIPR
jgi:hypothetical protein